MQAATCTKTYESWCSAKCRNLWVHANGFSRYL